MEIDIEDIKKYARESIVKEKVLNVCEMENGEFEFKIKDVPMHPKPDRDGIKEVWLTMRITPIEFGCLTGEEFVESKHFDKLLYKMAKDFAKEGVTVIGGENPGS